MVWRGRQTPASRSGSSRSRPWTVIRNHRAADSSEDRGGECVRRVSLHSWEHVLVNGQGERRVSVTQSLAYDLERNPLFQEYRSVRMPEVVETNPG
jgi:hypothetical protein